MLFCCIGFSGMKHETPTSKQRSRSSVLNNPPTAEVVGRTEGEKAVAFLFRVAPVGVRLARGTFVRRNQENVTTTIDRRPTDDRRLLLSHHRGEQNKKPPQKPKTKNLSLLICVAISTFVSDDDKQHPTKQYISNGGKEPLTCQILILFRSLAHKPSVSLDVEKRSVVLFVTYSFSRLGSSISFGRWFPMIHWRKTCEFFF